MLIYILVAIFPLLIGNLYDKKVRASSSFDIGENKKVRWKYILLAAFPMFFLIAFRNQDLGADTGIYLLRFQEMINTPWNAIFDNSRMEHGYLVFVKLVTYITHSPLGFQIIYTTFYLLAITSFANELEENQFFVLFLFATFGIYIFMFTGVRQCLAISICMFSFCFVKRRKIVPFALLILLAFYFHKSAILFIAAYLIYPRKLSWWNLVIYIVLMLLAVLYLDVIQQWFNDQLEYDYGIEGNTGGLIFSLVIVSITVFTIFLIQGNKSLNKQSQGLINIGLIATLFWVLRLSTRVAERPSYYFLPFLLAALAYAINNIKNQKEKDIVKIIIIVLALALYVYKFFTSFASLVPYSFYSF